MSSTKTSTPSASRKSYERRITSTRWFTCISRSRWRAQSHLASRLDLPAHQTLTMTLRANAALPIKWRSLIWRDTSPTISSTHQMVCKPRTRTPSEIWALRGTVSIASVSHLMPRGTWLGGTWQQEISRSIKSYSLSQGRQRGALITSQWATRTNPPHTKATSTKNTSNSITLLSSLNHHSNKPSTPNGLSGIQTCLAQSLWLQSTVCRCPTSTRTRKGY